MTLIHIYEACDGWDIQVVKDGVTTVFRWDINDTNPGRVIEEAFKHAGHTTYYDEVY